MSDCQPPAVVTLPEPGDPAYLEQLRRDRDAHLDNWEAQAFAQLAGSIKAEIARLMSQPGEPAKPVQGADGRVGVVKHVGVNCDGRVVAQMQEWKGGPTTYYAENLEVLK